jgi:hypothetical protein
MSHNTELIIILATILASVAATVAALYANVVVSATERRKEHLRRLESIARYLDVGEIIERSATKFDADLPISSASEDVVDRSPFVGAIVRLLSASGQDLGLAIGITGGWGAGKTSVLNLISAQLRELGRPYVVLRVEPWSANRRGDLTADVYQRIGSMLMANYIRTREEGQQDKTLLKLAGQFMSLAMYFLDLEQRRALQRFCLDVGLPIAAKASITIYEVFDQIAVTLRERQYKLVICFDDVDRLGTAEVFEFMRLVTTLRDLPRTTLIAATNLDQLETAFGREAIPKEYLEKVFQALIPLPATPSYVLQGMWLEGVNRISDGSLSKALQDPHFQKLLVYALPLLGSLRIVRRVQNAFSYFWRILGNKIDIADLVALSVIATVRPQLFDQFAVYRSVLVGEASSVAFSTPSRDDTTSAIDSILEEFTVAHRSYIRELLLELFPYAAINLTGARSSSGRASYPRAEWRAARRIADPHLFELALSQSAAEPGGFLPAEIWPIIRGAEDARQIEQSFLSFIRMGRGAQLLTALQAEIFEADETSIDPLSAALMALSTQFYDERRDLLVNNRLRLTWLLNELLSRLPEMRRFDILRKAINAGDDVYLFVAYYVSVQLESTHREADKTPILPGAFLARLLDDIVERLMRDIVSGELFRRQYLLSEGLLGFAIYRYIEWRGEEGRLELVQALESDAIFGEYLAAFAGYGPQYTDDLVKLNGTMFRSQSKFGDRVHAFRASRYWQSLSEDGRAFYESVTNAMMSNLDDGAGGRGSEGGS